MKISAFRVAPHVAAAALALLIALPGAAQPTIRGRLEAGDKEFTGGRVSDEYPVRVRAGTRLTVTTIATRPLMTAVMMQSPTDGLQGMEVGGQPVGDQFEWVYTRDITRDETVTVIVAGVAPVAEPAGSGSYTIRIDAPGGGAAPASPRPGNPAPRAGTGELPEVVATQLNSFAQLVGRNGFRIVGRPLPGALNGGTEEVLPLTLTAREYIAVGVCDRGCSDLDLRLVDGDGNTVVQDVANDDTPLLAFTLRAAGEYRLHVMMPACGAGPCSYGVAVFAK